jgi:hypothetical protein
LRLRNHSMLKHSSRNFPLKLSLSPFCHGLPGSIKAVSMFASASQLRMAWLTNSGPLSERRNAGAPSSRVTSAHSISREKLRAFEGLALTRMKRSR